MISSLLTLLLSATTVVARTKFAGINISGFDFTITTEGLFTANSQNTDPNGEGQMEHFASNDSLNLFRLPVPWQFMTASAGGPLIEANFAIYDNMVQSCLSTGAHCIVDVHNYARWDGQIIGQGGPTDAEFASLWQQLATKYSNTTNVIFGVMNEPHDLPSITTWAATVQAAVTAIRTAGATSQMILLPGNDFASAQSFVSGGSAAALSTVRNPDGTNTSLIFDVHKYLDYDGSGTHTECVSDHVNDTFVPLAQFLRANGRMAMLSETGGGNTASCLQNLCTLTSYLNSNSDVFLGYSTWAAGGFAQSYELNEVPVLSNGKWIDQELVTQCVVATRTNSTSSSNSTTGSPGTVTTGTPRKAFKPIRIARGLHKHLAKHNIK